MVSNKRKLRSLRRLLIRNLLKVLKQLNEKLDQGIVLTPNEIFFVNGAPLTVEQLMSDRLYGEVELEDLKNTFASLIEFR